MSGLDEFWVAVDAQLAMLRTAKTADDVVRMLGGKENASSGDAFFAGSGGDDQVFYALQSAGWSTAWYEAIYYWGMTAPDGSAIHYVEGDIYLGVGRPLPHGDPA